MTLVVEKTIENFFKLISLKSTRDILTYLNEHDTVQHAELNSFMNAATLYVRLTELLEFSLIEHHLEKILIRKEWYTITKKGRKILNYLDRFPPEMGLAAAISILKSIENGENQYKDFRSFAPSSTVNSRIRQLEALEFIEHHLERSEKRREWYTLTEKGKGALRIAEKLEKVFRED